MTKRGSGCRTRLGAAQGSVDLKPDSKVGTACLQWIKELRVRLQWANPKIRPQTVDEYERLLGNHVVPRLGKLRLYELTPARCQAWIDGIVARGQGKKNDLISTTISARGLGGFIRDDRIPEMSHPSRRFRGSRHSTRLQCGAEDEVRVFVPRDWSPGADSKDHPMDQP